VSRGTLAGCHRVQRHTFGHVHGLSHFLFVAIQFPELRSTDGATRLSHRIFSNRTFSGAFKSSWCEILAITCCRRLSELENRVRIVFLEGVCGGFSLVFNQQVS
jgi:hypothetical protein